MIRKILLTLAITTTAFVAGCNGTQIDTNALGQVIGQQNAELLSAGGKWITAESLSQKDEDAIGQSVAVGLTNRFQLASNQNTLKYVNLVGLAVASASANPGGNWVFGVLETPEVNAFSGPNGYVFVTRGALRMMQDEAELAGVLAHEIAHCTNHDGLEQVKAAERKGSFSQAMKAADTRLAQVAVFADTGLDVVTSQGYDQPQELRADQQAVQLLAASGYNPSSYLSYLRRLQGQGAPRGGRGGAAGAGGLMSTHPGLNQRIDAVTRQIQQLRLAPNTGATLAQEFQFNTR